MLNNFIVFFQVDPDIIVDLCPEPEEEAVEEKPKEEASPEKEGDGELSGSPSTSPDNQEPVDKSPDQQQDENNIDDVSYLVGNCLACVPALLLLLFADITST